MTTTLARPPVSPPARTAARAAEGPPRVHPADGPGPRTRVELTGTGTDAQVRTALTRAWRLAGQPIIVVTTPGMNTVGRAAADWAAEHACAGIGLEVRHTTPAAYPPCVVIDAANPAPWCGCVAPPCARCLDEPPPCRGCASTLCPDCAGGR